MVLATRDPQKKKPTYSVNKLLRTQNLFESLLEGLSDVVVILKHDGTIVFTNVCTEKIFGYQRHELVGKSLEILIPERFRDAHVHHRAAYAAEPLTRPMGLGLEVVARRRDGSEFPVEITLSPIETADGTFITSVVRDISRRKQMEQMLRDSEQKYIDLAHELEQQLIISDRFVSLGELAASIAHELNNPLQNVLGFLQDLLTEIEPSHPHHQPMTIIEKEAGRCKKIVQDLLDFARPAIADKQMIDLQDVLRNSTSLILRHLEKAKVEAEFEIERDLPWIYADPQQIGQVLLNLIFNAVEAMPSGGVLILRAEKAVTVESIDRMGAGALNEVKISVTDTGKGISPEHLPKVFRAFFTTKKKGGMGLGLSICETIVKSHGGRIEVKSSPGSGAAFSVYLPVPGK